jgi:hypothetical protein
MGKRNLIDKDLTGKKIGKWTVLERSDSDKHYWLCVCKCGTKKSVFYKSLLRPRKMASKCCGKCSKRKKRSKYLDLTNRKFGRLVVLGRDNNRETISGKTKRIYWKCACECGKTTSVLRHNLENGSTSSCGCLGREKAKKNYEDLVGRKFGRLVVIKRVGRKWLCKCECGNETITQSTNMIDGRTTSCGCYAVEVRSGKNNCFWKGGVSSINIKKRADAKSRMWSVSVKRRDKYICQKCGFKGMPKDNMMRSHHILSFNDHINERTNIDNGITFCVKCHKDFHNIYGRTSDNEKVNDFLLKSKGTRLEKSLPQ